MREVMSFKSSSGAFNALSFASLLGRLYNFIKPVSTPQHTLMTLPLEIIVQVLKEVDWYSLLTLRETCKLLNNISRTRPIWISQYCQYTAQHMHVARLEEPLDSYSAQELEQWVLFRRSAHSNWRCKDTMFSRARWINHKDVGGACLVPGGRWLLVGGWDGSVTVYDLDASNMTGRLLVPPDDERQPANRIVVDVHSSKQSPDLTFTLALSPAVQFSGSQFPLKNHIWRVNLAGHSTDALLTATHLCSIQTDHDNTRIPAVDLKKNIFARIHSRQNPSHIEVFDWQQSTSLSHCKDVIYPGMKIGAIRILSGDRLLAFSDTKMMIYGFVAAKIDISTPASVPQITEPLWEYDFDPTRIALGALSRGLSDESATYFVVKTRNINGLIIPHDKGQLPGLHQLAEWDSPEETTYAIGFGKAFVQHMDQSITRLSYSWAMGDANTGSCPSNTSVHINYYPSICNSARLPKMDEETGRIIQDLSNGVCVIDTATFVSTSQISSLGLDL